LLGSVHYHVNLLHREPSSPARTDYAWRSINIQPSWLLIALLHRMQHRQFICLCSWRRQWFGLRL